MAAAWSNQTQGGSLGLLKLPVRWRVLNSTPGVSCKPFCDSISRKHQRVLISFSMQALCSKLKTHWTSIAHHLYLKTDAPVPLPAVGPLAELLNVTTAVCQEVLALAAAGNLLPADISTALETNTVCLLGRLVQWLQAEPNDQLLLNTERSESLWQLLLLTLANMLKNLQPDQQVDVDTELINSFKQQLQGSGMLGHSESTSSDGSSSKPAEQPAQPAASGIIAALQWLLQHHPQRCLTASMGAWLLLIELGTTSGSPQPSNGSAATEAAGKGGAGTMPPFALADGMAPALAQVLQAYVDCAYANIAQPPAAPLPQAAVSTAAAFSSGNTSTPVRKMASREKLDSSSSPVATPHQKKRGSATAAEEGSPGAQAGEGKPAAVDAGTVLKGFAHAVYLVDDPSTAVFKHLLSQLHSLQIQLLVLAATVPAGEQQEGQEEGPALPLPHATNMQVLAIANMWLQQQAGAAAAAGRQYQHQALLPLPAVALAALHEVGMDSIIAVQQLEDLCCKALQRDCVTHVTFKRQQLLQQQHQQTSGDAGSSSSSGAAANSSSSSSSVGKVEPVEVFQMLMDSVSLQRACGAAVREECFNAVALAARVCMRNQAQQLLQQRGTELLHVLLQYVQQDPIQQQPAAAADGGDNADAAAAERALAVSQRCAICANVLMDVCSTGRGLDDSLLACLTNTDPAAFYAIMDLLVRRLHPDALALLLPMSACFLQHDRNAMMQMREQLHEQQQQQEGTGGQKEPSSVSSSSSISSAHDVIAASRSLVVLHDPDVCRTFAAALHGYSKTALAHLDDEEADVHGCSGCGHDHGHDHGHEHHHHHHHGTDIVNKLQPLQQVATWLLTSYDITTRAAQDSSTLQELKTADAAAAGSSGSNDSSSGERMLLSVNKQAQQLQAASQAAAGSLVLTVLLARAATPILDWMQTQLKQLSLAAAGSNGSSGGSNAGDVVLPLGTAMDVYAGLAFVRNAWQAIGARFALGLTLQEQVEKLCAAAAAAAQASAASAAQLPKSKGSAAAAAAAACETEAAAAAAGEGVARGMKAAAAATSAAVHGRGLARGWSHLAYLLPKDALVAARDFQQTWPGNLLMDCQAHSVLEAARDKLIQQEHGHSSSHSSDDAHVVLPAHAHQELQRLTRDAQRMFAGVMDAVPLPVGCNNPGCTRLEAVAEATLSINKRCSQCLAAHYCCKDCQVQHWPAHKTACKRLRQQVPGKPAVA